MNESKTTVIQSKNYYLKLTNFKSPIYLKCIQYELK